MADGYPVVASKLPNNPVAAEAADAAVLLATERTGYCIVHAVVVHMRHASVHAEGEPDATLSVAGENGAGQAVLRVVGDLQRLCLAADLNDGRDRPEYLFLCYRHIVSHVDEHVRGQYLAVWQATDQLPCSGGVGAFDMLQVTCQLLLEGEALIPR